MKTTRLLISSPVSFWSERRVDEDKYSIFLDKGLSQDKTRLHPKSAPSFGLKRTGLFLQRSRQIT